MSKRANEQGYSDDFQITRRLSGYSTWEQVAGYFDGDGTIGIKFGLYTIQLLAVWSDTDAEQIRHVYQFLESEGMSPERPHLRHGSGRSRDAYNLALSEEGGLLKVLQLILPFVDKKKGQVEGAISYLEDRITADQFVDVLNRAIKQAKRRPPHGRDEYEILVCGLQTKVQT